LILGLVTLGTTNAKPNEDIRIETYIEQEMDRNIIPGLSVGIIENGEIIYLRGFGQADLSNRQVTAQTPFIIGSMSKFFTALAVMQLVEAGKIDLDTPVQYYIPDFTLTDRESSALITTRHLLNQNSGISNIEGLRQCADMSDYSIGETVEKLKSTELAHPVGSRFMYSNSNYVVLELLVESVSGDTYGH